MEHQNILNLLIEANDSKFVARKWNIVNDNSNANYGIIYNTEVLKFNLCDYNDAYILVILPLYDIKQHKYHLKIEQNFLNVSEKLMKQQQMMLKI